MAQAIEMVLSGGSFLEAPRWHEGRVWASDFYQHQVFSVAEDGSDRRLEAEVPGQPSGLGWLPDGRLLVVSMRDRRLLRREADGTLVTHADLSAWAAGHLNDMVVDAQGRAYVGNFGFDLASGNQLASTSLIRVDPDGTVTVVADGLWFPNGSVITDDGVLLVGETFGNRISAFDIAPDGSLGPRRDWATFGPPPTASGLGDALAQIAVAPDGSCLDADGAVWTADAAGGRVLRVAEGGRVLEEIPLVDTAVFACMLGGSDGRTLYLCCAPDFDERSRSAAAEASLRAVRVGAPRAGRP